MTRDIIYISLFAAAAVFLWLKRKYQQKADEREYTDSTNNRRRIAQLDIVIPVCGALIIIIADILIYGPWFSADIQAEHVINSLKLYTAETALLVYTVFKVWEQFRKKQR